MVRFYSARRLFLALISVEVTDRGGAIRLDGPAVGLAQQDSEMSIPALLDLHRFDALKASDQALILLVVHASIRRS
jgi:hypothetical protein